MKTSRGSGALHASRAGHASREPKGEAGRDDAILCDKLIADLHEPARAEVVRSAKSTKTEFLEIAGNEQLNQKITVHQ